MRGKGGGGVAIRWDDSKIMLLVFAVTEDARSKSELKSAGCCLVKLSSLNSVLVGEM